MIAGADHELQRRQFRCNLAAIAWDAVQLKKQWRICIGLCACRVSGHEQYVRQAPRLILMSLSLVSGQLQCNKSARIPLSATARSWSFTTATGPDKRYC